LQEYETGTDVTFSGNVTDDCQVAVSDVNVTFNITTAGTSYYCYSSSTENPYTCLWPTSGKLVGNYNVTMIASESYYNSHQRPKAGLHCEISQSMSLIIPETM